MLWQCVASRFHAERVRVGLVHPVAPGVLDAELVAVAGARALDEAAPAAAAVLEALQGLAVPLVEGADHAHVSCIGRPDGEPGPFFGAMGTHHLELPMVMAGAPLSLGARPRGGLFAVLLLVQMGLHGLRRCQRAILELRCLAR